MITPAQAMARALALAARGGAEVHPNPRVGCVLVRAGRVVGEGYHHRFGGPHAEVEALCQAGAAACGATAYVTLEPCSHHGKTPPCADALIAAGVASVVAALEDPNPLVAGQGLARLRAAGVAVEVGLGADEARRLNRPFLTLMEQHRPWVTLKLATSLDGRIADAAGESRWITGPEARREGHRLRRAHRAVVTGVGTLLADDPELTVRAVRPGRRPPARVVLDSALRTPPGARLLRTPDPSPCLIVGAEGAPAARADALRAAGAEVLLLPAGPDGRPALGALLGALAARGLSPALVEAGTTLASAFLDADAVDEVAWFQAPLLLGGADARPALRLPEPRPFAARLRLVEVRTRRLGPDLLVRGLIDRADTAPGAGPDAAVAR